jgi:fructokinase
VITVVGEALVDLVLEPDGEVTAALGGAPFNTARTCGRLDAPVCFAGTLSSDRFGNLLMAQLVADGVAVGGVERSSLPTTLALAELDDGGAASYRFYIEGTSAPALVTPIVVAPGVLFTGGLALALQPMASAVEATVDAAGDDVLVMIDVNARPAIVRDRDEYVRRVERLARRAQIVKVSDEDLAYLAPGVPPIDAAAALLASGPEVVLLTAGGDGVTVLAGAGRRHVDVRPVDVADTIGAGDAFSGGFISYWTAASLSTADLGSIDDVVAAVEAACTVAGVVCSRRGADPPWRRELPDDWAPHAD